jgi:hypothetical protein
MTKRLHKKVRELAVEEKLLIYHYHQLDRLETRSYYLSIRCFLLTGNIRLLWGFYRRSLGFLYDVQVA